MVGCGLSEEAWGKAIVSSSCFTLGQVTGILRDWSSAAPQRPWFAGRTTGAWWSCCGVGPTLHHSDRGSLGRPQVRTGAERGPEAVRGRECLRPAGAHPRAIGEGGQCWCGVADERECCSWNCWLFGRQQRQS